MRRTLLSLAFCFLLAFGLSAQADKITTMSLHNGMNVILCEDHEQPQIYGAVCVHVGAKNDPLDNTGMAHYFEHIMFKGTDRIGTLDWKNEKVYLDSISILYDQLHGETDVTVRNNILMHINNLSNKATEYAIPNEVDVILGKMGGEGVNAFTSNDVTCYHNYFPSNQLEKWLNVYTERFRNPVFRLFQTELETVYEEYNMYQDNPMSVFMEDAIQQAYGEHPYGRPVIGWPEHLKNPQTSAMQKFFNTYYHPFNMTLILVGDFNAGEIKPLLERTIGNLRNEGEGVDEALAQSAKRMNTNLNLEVKPFKGHQIINVKETPVKMGILGFQTVGSADKDALYLDILSNLLNNESETGLLDKLNTEKKVLMVQAFNYAMLEKGMYAFFYAPKILGQTHDEAEALILAAIDSIRQGNFSDQLFDAVKMDYLTAYLSDMESLDNKFYVLLDLVMNQQDPTYYYEKEQIVRNLKKEDLMKIADKYFGNNYMSFRSSMGVKAHEKLQKPAWKPIAAKNTEAESEYALSIEKMDVTEIQPQNIEFSKAVTKMPVSEKYTLYCSPNPHNDIFSMRIVFNCGTLSDPKLGTAVDYLSMQGSEKMTFSAFQLALQQLGASLYVYTSDDRTYVYISGFDKDLDKILSLCHEKIFHPENNEKMLAAIIEDEAASEKMMKNDASTWGKALYNYAIYGESSPFLTGLSLKELKKVSGRELLNSFAQVLNYDGFVTYVGNADINVVVESLENTFGLSSEAQEGKRMARPIKTYKEPTLFLASNKQFLQSNIYFHIPGHELYDPESRAACSAYNEYMDGSMAGVIFQEIRELRSLGYSAYGFYSYDVLNRRPGYIYGYLGTQSDKTVEGCQAMRELLVKLPKKRDKFETAKVSAIKKAEADYVTFRSIPGQIESWEEQGYKNDPRMEKLSILENTTFDSVAKFFEKNVAGNPLVITVAGDKKRIDVNELSKGYKLVEVKYKDIIK